MNRLKQNFVDKIICTAQFHHPYVSISAEKGKVNFPEVIHNIPLLRTFSSEGWALPAQNIFKHSYEQKRFCLFHAGSNNWKKNETYGFS